MESHELQSDGMTIGYRNLQGVVNHVQCSWLIGADGKRGVVRKRFLEPDAGIRQQEGRYKYEGTWVAANLKITPPTAQSHPLLPFWDLGMTPDEVCDLYWPKGWHFCTPPGKATACGLFGPYRERLWRHEFAEPKWNDSMDSTALFWEHITPMITRDRTDRGKRFPDGPIAFPQDCINVLRCRPFLFAQKCVNKWFDRRRILIGDSAHVFPVSKQPVGACVEPRSRHGMSLDPIQQRTALWSVNLLPTPLCLRHLLTFRSLHLAIRRRRNVFRVTRCTSACLEGRIGGKHP